MFRVKKAASATEQLLFIRDNVIDIRKEFTDLARNLDALVNFWILDLSSKFVL